jgi:hypothetical protein
VFAKYALPTLLKFLLGRKFHSHPAILPVQLNDARRAGDIDKAYELIAKP